VREIEDQTQLADQAMSEREQISLRARSFFDDLWGRGDPWELETSEFERQRYARLMAMLDQSKYGSVLEIGCGAGAFTQLLAPRAERVLALDISATAIARAQRDRAYLQHVEFRVANIMDHDPHDGGPWDLIVMSETIYFLGWLYSFFDVAWLTSQLLAATRPSGQVLLANSQAGMSDPLLLPWIVRTYRDLFVNVGYALQKEEIFCAQKKGVEFEILISLLRKASATPHKDLL
jgi:SAM-dependent methyltransferase